MREREFWVVYDYGTGGVWGVACAPSKAEIVRIFPELQVIDETPSWMTADRKRAVRSASHFVVGKPTTYPEWLTALIEAR